MEEELKLQIARNEALFRDVNEALGAGEWPGDQQRAIAFRCECGELGCSRLIELTAREYERIRAHPRRFLVARHHDHEEAEHVVETHERYLVVEKDGASGRIADATDPRR